jgi:hypothetical protein
MENENQQKISNELETKIMFFFSSSALQKRRITNAVYLNNESHLILKHCCCSSLSPYYESRCRAKLFEQKKGEGGGNGAVFARTSLVGGTIIKNWQRQYEQIKSKSKIFLERKKSTLGTALNLRQIFVND